VSVCVRSVLEEDRVLGLGGEVLHLGVERVSEEERLLLRLSVCAQRKRQILTPLLLLPQLTASTGGNAVV